MVVFAGAESVPVIGQALGILASAHIRTFNDENLDLEIPEGAIVLAATGTRARLPSRFLHLMPKDINARKMQAESRKLEVPQPVLEIPNLVLIRPCPLTENGMYGDERLLGFREALLSLAGVKHV